MIWKELVISKDSVSGVLYKRWIGCYMLYDWNLRHAEHAFDNNEIGRYQKVAEMLGENFKLTPKGSASLTELYNKVLVEDVEDFIRRHMEVWPCGRCEIELEIAKTMAEIFEDHKGD